MKKAKRYSEIDLANFYAISPVFKRYSQFNPCPENFNEYNNLKYCERYLAQFFGGCTQKYILEYFSEYFWLTLCNNPKFGKFVNSGFFKYINWHFLVLYQNNRFFFFGDSHKEIEIFVEEYFQRYIKFFFEQDLLRCIITCINEVVSNSFKKYLNTRVKYIYKDLLLIESKVKPLSNSVVILNSQENKKKERYPLGFVDYKDTVETFYSTKSIRVHRIDIKSFYSTRIRHKIYKSLNLSQEIPGIFVSNFFLEDTIYRWAPRLIGKYNQLDLSKTFGGVPAIIFNRKEKFTAKVYYSLVSDYNWCFYRFSKRIYKSVSRVTFQTIKKEKHSFKNDFLFLLESYKFLVSFDNRRNDIGIYHEGTGIFVISLKNNPIKLV